MFIDAKHAVLVPPYPERIVLSGLSYRQTPVELRERFSITSDANQALLGQVLAHPEVREAVVLSTCNRTEIVTASPPDESAEESQERLIAVQGHIESVLADYSGVPRNLFAQNMYHLHDTAAVGHLFKVAAGIDSMVVGEPQVLGQLKTAFSLAADLGATSGLLNGLFQRAFSVAKEIRTETRIGRDAVSVCYAARELAVQIFGDLGDASVMMLGTGETGCLALKHFKSAGVKRFLIASRTLSRAAAIAEPLAGVALELQAPGVANFLPQADIVIGASTALQDYLLTLEEAELSAKARRGKPQFFIDLGVPRNIDPAVANLSDSFLYDIDDLGAIVSRNLDNRTIEVKRAELIVDAQVERFTEWLERRKAGEVIRDARERFDSLHSRELDRTRRRLMRSGLTQEQWNAIEPALADLAGSITAKLMHRPFALLNHASSRREQVAESFREFFIDMPQTRGQSPAAAPNKESAVQVGTRRCLDTDSDDPTDS